MKFILITFTIILVLIFTLFFILPSLHSFLSITRPVESKILVVEGWLFDYMLDEAVEVFNKEKYKIIITTGGKIFHTNSNKGEFNNYAEYAKKKFIMRGIDSDLLFAVSAPQVKNHKTYNSAYALKKWIVNNKPEIKALNIFTGGPHGRKTFHIFKNVLEKDIKVGIISSNIKHYDPVYWWKSATGIKVTLKFFFGYIYAVIYPESLLNIKQPV